MLPHFNTLVAPLAPLAELGVEVLNCTPGSAFKCFPNAELEKSL